MIEWIGYLAGIVTTACYLPQLWKIYRSRHADDISSRSYMLLFLGLSLWFLYGLMSSNWPVIIANGISLGFVALILTLKKILRKKT